MADMFMKLGDIKGEARETGHQDEIEVLVWGWGLSQSGGAGANAGGSAPPDTGARTSASAGTGIGAGPDAGACTGTLTVQDFSFTKFTDRSTPAIIAACARGTRMESAVLTMRKAGGDAPLDYYRITLGGVMVSAYASGGSGGEGRFTENVTLNFERFRIEYQPHDGQGGTAGDTVQAGWDIPRNAAI